MNEKVPEMMKWNEVTHLFTFCGGSGKVTAELELNMNYLINMEH